MILFLPEKSELWAVVGPYVLEEIKHVWHPVGCVFSLSYHWVLAYVERKSG
jgi:hypothetical protein